MFIAHIKLLIKESQKRPIVATKIDLFQIASRFKVFYQFLHFLLIFSEFLQSLLKIIHKSLKGYELLGSQSFEATSFLIIVFFEGIYFTYCLKNFKGLFCYLNFHDNFKRQLLSIFNVKINLIKHNFYFFHYFLFQFCQ